LDQNIEMPHNIDAPRCRFYWPLQGRFPVKSGLAAARARDVKLGRQVGQRPSDKKAKRVLALYREGLSYRLIGRNVGLSKNTVMEIVRRETAN
jgi:DNA invertase Pin-like site-specific DNA recombinase